MKTKHKNGGVRMCSKYDLNQLYQCILYQGYCETETQGDKKIRARWLNEPTSSCPNQ
jgi:hypothetical protein